MSERVTLNVSSLPTMADCLRRAMHEREQLVDDYWTAAAWMGSAVHDGMGGGDWRTHWEGRQIDSYDAKTPNFTAAMAQASALVKLGRQALRNEGVEVRAAEQQITGDFENAQIRGRVDLLVSGPGEDDTRVVEVKVGSARGAWLQAGAYAALFNAFVPGRIKRVGLLRMVRGDTRDSVPIEWRSAGSVAREALRVIDGLVKQVQIAERTMSGDGYQRFPANPRSLMCGVCEAECALRNTKED